jgi:RNA polymerase-binding protein DksA
MIPSTQPEEAFSRVRMRMTKQELDDFRQRLMELGQRLKGDVSDLSNETLRRVGGEASGSLSNAPLHMADLGTDQYQQEVDLSLLETEEQRLEEIAAALRRIDEGTFGRCQECGKEIGRERLQALPFARWCVACARRQEQENASTKPPGNL